MASRTPGGIRPASRLFNRLLRHTLGRWLVIRYRVRFEASVLRTLTPPFLLVGNHTCNWDPFILSVPVRVPVHFVASDEYFRTPLLRFAFSLVGGIPKTKNVRDTQAVRTMLGLKRAGAVLGLYPEGNRSWDGVTGPIYGATAKLVRKLGIPVVAVETTGGSLTQPRWARHARHGPMRLAYRLLFTPEDCRSLPETVITERLVDALAHDDAGAADADARAGRPARYTGRRLAERLERFLFLCPACGRQDTLASRGSRLSCAACGRTVSFGTDGRFHPLPGTPGEAQVPSAFDTPRDWNRWQCDLLAETIRSGMAASSAPAVLMQNLGARHQTGGRTGRLAEAGTGTLTLLADRLVFRHDGSELHGWKRTRPDPPPLEIPLAGASGLNIQYNDRFELYAGDTLHRFSFPNTGISVWKWHQALLYAGVPGPDETGRAESGPAETGPAETGRTEAGAAQAEPAGLETRATNVQAIEQAGGSRR